MLSEGDARAPAGQRPTESVYPIIAGLLHAPYFIFLRDSALPRDEDVLDQLYSPPRSWWRRPSVQRSHTRRPLTDHPSPGEEYIYLGEQGGWLMIADDWSYHLWYRRDRRKLLARFADHYELFALLRPDVDESYEFVHFVGGRRVRERRVDSPHLRDRVVAIDYGRRFPCETEALYAKDPDDIVWTVAGEAGVPQVHDRATLRRYGRT